MKYGGNDADIWDFANKDNHHKLLEDWFLYTCLLGYLLYIHFKRSHTLHSVVYAQQNFPIHSSHHHMPILNLHVILVITVD